MVWETGKNKMRDILEEDREEENFTSKMQVNKMFLSLCVSKVSEIVGGDCSWLWMRCSQRMIPKLLFRVSGSSLQLPQTPEDQDPEILPSSSPALSTQSWNLLSETETADRSDWIDRWSGIWCKKHLLFRISPVLKFHLEILPSPFHPYLTTNPQPHPYHTWTCSHWKPGWGHLIILAGVTLHSFFYSANLSPSLLCASQCIKCCG